MYFKQFLHEQCGCSSYLVASRESNEAAVIDPFLDIEPYLGLAADRHLTVRYAIDTHIHADHVSGNRRLAEKTGAELCLHESAPVRFPFRSLRHGEEIRLGQLILGVMHTPGHRPESISITVTNPPRSPAPSMVLTGDSLLVGDVGRPDFGGAEGAADLYHSLQSLLGLEDYVEVFPGHFEGPCGRGMCGRPSTTIGFERRFNPLLQLGSRDGFVEEVMRELPARPLNMDAIVATNIGEADFTWAMPDYDGPVPEASVQEAQTLLNGDNAFLLDVREAWEFEERRIPGAVLIPQSQLATRLAEVPKDRQVLVACGSGGRSEKASAFLVQTGYQRVTNLTGGTDAWADAGFPLDRG
jgi:glyoxylase-like metal-dependent hydrolase (beta-lactamase superfamily II)/rhodanese-related sulfurtransferase